MADRKGQNTPNTQEGDSTSTSGNPDRDNQSGQERQGTGTQRQDQGTERQGQGTERQGQTERTGTERTGTQNPERSDRTSEEGSNI
jgi:hypothetical protein